MNQEINSQPKWDAIRDKVTESASHIICLQETKKESFDQAYIRKFCPRHFSHFVYSPSNGATGGLVTIWNDHQFDADTVLVNSYSITLKMTSKLTNKSFHLTNIYGPAAADEKMAFITWLYNFDTDGIEDWLLARDFNLIRSTENRNMLGGNMQDMMLFDLIQHLDLVDIHFQGRDYTWNNMQEVPLLQKLDWVFTSTSWTLSYPDTSVKMLSRPISDHVPYVIAIGTQIPKSRIFRFENDWLEFEDFSEVVQLHWTTSPHFANAAKTLNAKFKQVRNGLKIWSRNLSKLNKNIHNASHAGWLRRTESTKQCGGNFQEVG